jgi:uncharacterized protein DUF1588/uncharacterized protein DUF1592/uncharacterized protein DUF1595/uncharacterized protein DUF1585/uncharacterized protein DUF1587
MSYRATRGLIGAGLATLSLSCIGNIGDGVGEGTAPLTCDENPRPSATDLRRLTAEQYRNTVIDVFAGVPGLDVAVVAAAALTRVPPDGTQNGSEPYTRMDGRLSPPHVEAYFDVADVIAQAFEANAAARSGLIGECANDAALTDECVDAFLDQFAWRAFRRPLEQDERDRFHAMNDGTHDGPELVRGLVFAALMSPEFLYHVEVGGAAIEGDDRFALDGYALASRLSYHFWGSMPDDALFDAAGDGSLLTEEGYRAEVDRVFEDPRTRATAESFYREWLRYDQVGGFKSSPVFQAFADDPAILADGPGLLAAMQGEVDELASYYTWEVGGDFRALLTSDVSVTSSPLLASLYGVMPWDGQGEPPRFDNRSGLLTRAALLVTGSHETNPVLRGAIVRRRILCQELTPPSPASLPPGSLDPPEFQPDMTTRQRYEEKTKNEPCASCHAQMNPIGFVLEQYDALGRYRTEERILDAETGVEIALLDIDPTAVPELTAGDKSSVSKPDELMERVADTKVVEGCFARNYFQFTWGRVETTDDHCAIERVENALVHAADGSDGPGSLREALRAIALDPSFRQRVVGPRDQ